MILKLLKCMNRQHNLSFKMNRKLDLGSIRSSPRKGLSTPYRLTIWNSARLFHHVFFNMGPAFGPSCTEFVCPECCHFDNDATSKIDDVLTEHVGTTPCPCSCCPPEIFLLDK